MNKRIFYFSFSKFDRVEIIKYGEKESTIYFPFLICALCIYTYQWQQALIQLDLDPKTDAYVLALPASLPGPHQIRFINRDRHRQIAQRQLYALQPGYYS